MGRGFESKSSTGQEKILNYLPKTRQLETKLPILTFN